MTAFADPPECADMRPEAVPGGAAVKSRPGVDGARLSGMGGTSYAPYDFRQIRRLCRVIGMVCLLLTLTRLAVDPGVTPLVLGGSVFATIGILLAPETVRFGISVRVVVWVAMLTGMAGLAAVLLSDGPGNSVATPLILLVPVVIALALNGVDTVRAGALSGAVVVLCFAAEVLGLTLDETAVSLPLLVLKCIVITSMLVVETLLLSGFAYKVRMTNLSLARAHEAAQAANVAKSQFLATASHELRTPLNGVIGMAQIMLRTELTEKQRKMAEIMDSSAVSLLKILNEVFDATEITSGLFRVLTTPFDAEDVVRNTVAAHEQAAWDKGLGLRVVVDRAARGRYLGDARRIEQVLARLTENALKFTEQGAVTIHLSRSGKGITQFHVIDAGPGLSSEDQSLIFDLFQQADQSETRLVGGLGLGLATSRTLAELMGGTLTVESAPGKGATFTLALPLRRAFDENLREKLAG